MGLISHKCSSTKRDSLRGTVQKFSWRRVSFEIVLCTSLTACLSLLAYAQNAGPDLSELSLDALSNTEITSVARKAEKLSQAAAAIFVISQEDIRRSGFTSIPELLRMVPGLNVAQMDANQWAVTARGFNERFADKTLVLIDGRTVYTPLSSGVYWDVQDTMLEDIERIEVIRGPGATLWGANAVNGVINIITKKAADTQGTLVAATTGSNEGGNGAVRYGGPLRGHGFYRIFTKYIGQSPFSDAQGHEAADDWHLLHGGFRSDWSLSKRDDLTVQGDIYKGNEGQTVSGLISLSPPVSGNFNDRTNVSGGDLLGRWTHTSSERFDTSVQAYFEVADRSQGGVLGEFRHTIDVELVQHFAQGTHHDFVWGADYRFASDRTIGSLNISFNPASRSTNLYGAFVQDEITLVPDKLHVTVGAKLEHNYYSGFAVQPNIRALWTVRQHYTIWAAISRAAENSSRFDADIRTNNDAFIDSNGVLNLESNFGTHHLPSENVAAFEVGQRAQVSKWLALDVDAFYNRYSNRHTHEPAAPFFEDNPAPPHQVLPSVTLSHIRGETHGLEVDGRLRPASFWNLVVGYTLFEIHLHTTANSQDFETTAESEGSSPRHAFLVRSELNLPHKLEFDTAAYFVGALVGPQIPSYTRVDARLGWHVSESLELSAGVQNLLTLQHLEFGSGDLLVATQVGRNAYGKFTWRF
jgi:iron complex outermembrane receptor protein